MLSSAILLDDFAESEGVRKLLFYGRPCRLGNESGYAGLFLPFLEENHVSTCTHFGEGARLRLMNDTETDRKIDSLSSCKAKRYED